MNEQQALRAVRNVIRLEALADRIVAPTRRELTRILGEVAAMVEAMDADPLAAGNTLFRQTRWRTILAQLQVMLAPASARFRDDLIVGLAQEIPFQVRDAERHLLDAGIEPFQRATEFSPGSGEVTLPPGIVVGPPAAGVGPVAREAGLPQLTRTQLYRAAARTEVLGKPLAELFEAQTARPPSPQIGRYRQVPDLQKGDDFIASQIRSIDRVVKRGFLLGETNQEIAKNLIGEGAARARREAETFARTAVMQMSADAHQAFWDANDSVIAGWEYDALMDYRTCPICAPWDGRTAERRADLPKVPRHPRCRCSVLPLTETEVQLRRERGPQRRTVIELIEADTQEEALTLARKQHKKIAPRRRKAVPTGGKEIIEPVRVYSRQVTVDGKRYWRVAVDIEQPKHPLTHGEFLARTSDESLRHVLQSKGRAQRFRRHIENGLSPDAALVRVTQDLRDPDRPGISARKRTRGLPPLGKSASPLQAPRVRPIQRRRRPAA